MRSVPSPLKTAGRIFLATAFALTVSACGVKSDLMKPDGKPTPKDQRDPSRPPNPIGQ